MRLPLQTRFATDPSGHRWRVSVRWLPWKPRTGDMARDATGLDLPDFGGFDDELGLGCAFLLVLALFIVLVPIGIFLLEVMLLVIVFVLLVLLGGALGLRRWTIEVEGPEPASYVSRIVARHRGVRAADASMRSISEAIERGTWSPHHPHDPAT